MCPINQVPTRYSNNNNDSNSVIDLMFLQCDSSELNNYLIHSEWCLISDYAPLLITISIAEENINLHKRTITKNSNEKESFIKEVITSVTKLDTSNISDIPELERVVNNFANIVDSAWMKNSKIINITKHVKSWWNDNYNKDLTKYRFSKNIEDWKAFQKTVKDTKRSFFNLKIQEIANKKHSPWELMSWVNKHKLPAIEMIKYNGQPCLELDDLWQALHSSFNTAQFHQIDENVLNELDLYSLSLWASFSEIDFTSIIIKYNNLSASEPDKLSWRHLKSIIKDKICLSNIIAITNICFNLEH